MTLSIIAERFRLNRRGFAAKFAPLLVLFGVALACDAISTTWFMLHDGPQAEVHPVVQAVSRIVGPVLGPWFGAIGKFTAAVVVAIYLRRWAAIILLLGTVLSLWAAWYNVWGQDIYVPNLLYFIPW